MTTDNNNSIKCIQKGISGNWLTNGHLEACILKLFPPAETEWQNDNNRTKNVSIIAQLLKPVEGSHQSLLAREFPDKPALVLTPELAFGSPDFESLDTLVRQYNQNLIFICGFGFTSGAALNTLADKSDIEGAWSSSPNANKKYNGGWVWVKDGTSTQCYIFLKNFPQQGQETSVPNWTGGDFILRLEGNDIVIFPLVCADLISKETNSPSSRIITSLAESSSVHKEVLITGSLLNIKSESGHWKAAIGDLLEASKASNTRLLLSNCIDTAPAKDEEIDKWRCLSGIYQHKEGCKSPFLPPPNIRYVDDTKFSGLVLRNTQTGALFGKLQWTNNPSQGMNALSECSRYIWNKNCFHHCDGDCAADELHRFIVRNKGSILHSKIASNEAAQTIADQELEKLLTELSPTSNSPLRAVAGKLFQKCLKGIKQEKQFCPDQLYSHSDNLDCAITTLKLIQHAIDASLMPEGKELGYGQLLSSDEEHEVLVWDSSEYSAKNLHNIAMEEVVIESGSARPLTIIGRGNNTGMPPPDGRIRSSRSADFTNAPPDTSTDKDIREHSDRVVFWKNQGHIDEILKSTDSAQNLTKSLREEIIVPEDS